MVNMVGFHHREPEYNTAIYGEEGHYFRILHRPRAGLPDRMLVSNPCGWSLFNNENDAVDMMAEDPIQKPAGKFYIRHLHGGPERIECGEPGYLELGE